MRIIQLITLTELGGAQTVVANLSNKLCKSNEVIVIAGGGDGALWGLLDERITKIECPSLMRSISPVNDLKTIVFFATYS